MLELTPQQVRAMRLKAQSLYPRASREGVAEVVRAVCGINAQLKPAMMLSLRARLRGAELRDLSDLIADPGVLVRTWAMRGTMHLLFKDDRNLILPLVGPPAIARLRSRRRELGLYDERLSRGLREIRAVLESGPLSRDELVSGLNGRGFDIVRKSQAPYHLIACAGMEGAIVLGPDRPNGEQTYMLADQPAGEPSLMELAERYLRGYGPASPADFAAWSGLPAADAKKGWELLRESGPMTDITVDGRALAALETEPAPLETTVSLLPAFDTLVLGYSDRSLIVPEKHYKDVYHGGQTVPVVLVDGMAAGVWRYKARGKRIDIEVRPFGALDRNVRDLVREEAEDVGRFFGLATTIEWHNR